MSDEVLFQTKYLTLFRMLYNLPWLLEVIAFDFNPQKAQLLLEREAAKIRLQQIEQQLER